MSSISAGIDPKSVQPPDLFASGARRRGPLQAIADRLAETAGRDRHHRDRAHVRPIEPAQHREQIGRRLRKVAARAKVERCPRARQRPRAEREQRLVGGDRARLEPQRPRRRVVARELARRPQRLAGVGRTRGQSPDLGLERAARDAPRPQQAGPAAAEVEHGRFEPDRARPAIEDDVDRGAQSFGDVIRGRRADPPGRIGARRRDREPGRREQRLRDRMRGHPQTDRIPAGADQRRQRAARRARQHQGQGTRPEPRGQAFREVVPAGERRGRRPIRHVDDQRVEPRPALGREDRGDRAVVGRERAEAVDGLGRKGDQPARAQRTRRLPRCPARRCRGARSSAIPAAQAPAHQSGPAQCQDQRERCLRGEQIAAHEAAGALRGPEAETKPMVGPWAMALEPERITASDYTNRVRKASKPPSRRRCRQTLRPARSLSR